MGENRKRLGAVQVGHKFIADGERTSEAQIVTLPGGGLKAFVRNHSSRREVAVATSRDGGVTWEDFHYIGIPQPVCQIAALTSKTATARRRSCSTPPAKQREKTASSASLTTTARRSQHSLKIKDGEFVYSCMTQMKDGSIGVLFEGSTMHETVDFLKLTLDDIKASEEKI